MKFITNSLNGEKVKISYSDYGQGNPVVLIHGWPLSKHMWEYQVNDLVNAGLRVIKYDRRGFGDSDKPWDNYDYDTLASDLNSLMEELDLHNAVVVGFSMGGGEAVRFLHKYGSDRIAGIVLVSSVTPYLCKADDNPNGVDKSVFQEMMDDMKEDRISFLDDFGKKILWGECCQ